MKITLLGTGTPALLPQRLGPATLLTVGAAQLLFDTGRGAAVQLVRAGVALEDLTAIFITHYNYDHLSDLGDVLISAW